MTPVLPPPTSTAPPPSPDNTFTNRASEQARSDQGLARPSDGRVLGGVCAGLADLYGWNRRTTRLLAVLSLLLPGPQVLLYLGLWLFVPDASDGARIVDVDKVRDDVNDIVGGRHSPSN